MKQFLGICLLVFFTIGAMGGWFFLIFDQNKEKPKVESKIELNSSGYISTSLTIAKIFTCPFCHETFTLSLRGKDIGDWKEIYCPLCNELIKESEEK